MPSDNNSCSILAIKIENCIWIQARTIYSQTHTILLMLAISNVMGKRCSFPGRRIYPLQRRIPFDVIMPRMSWNRADSIKSNHISTLQTQFANHLVDNQVSVLIMNNSNSNSLHVKYTYDFRLASQNFTFINCAQIYLIVFTGVITISTHIASEILNSLQIVLW